MGKSECASQPVQDGPAAIVSSLFLARGNGAIDLPLDSGERYDFAVDAPYPVQVKIGAPSCIDPADPYRARYEYFARRPINNKVAAALQVLATGQLPPGSVDHRDGIQENGSTRLFPAIGQDGRFDPTQPAEYMLLPADLQEIFHGPSRYDFLHVLRVASVIAWRFDWSRERLRHKSERTECQQRNEIAQNQRSKLHTFRS